MDLRFAVSLALDLKHYVVEVLMPDQEDDWGGEWVTITEPFDTEAEAREWVKHLKSNHRISGE